METYPGYGEAVRPYAARGRVDVGVEEQPPFDLTSDMLVALALCPTAPLRHTFPGVPFLSVLGRTPLVVWFSRVKRGCYDDAAGSRRCAAGENTVPYNELTVVALLRERAFFVPAIYATGERTIRIGHHYYGMPKAPTLMSLRVTRRWVTSRVVHGSHESRLRARLLGSGRLLAALLSWLWPRQVWPARFPSGGEVCAVIQATPRVCLAQVREGELALDAAAMPMVAAPFWPVAVYLPDLQMRLPSPP